MARKPPEIPDEELIPITNGEMTLYVPKSEVGAGKTYDPKVWKDPRAAWEKANPPKARGSKALASQTPEPPGTPLNTRATRARSKGTKAAIEPVPSAPTAVPAAPVSAPAAETPVTPKKPRASRPKRVTETPAPKTPAKPVEPVVKPHAQSPISVKGPKKSTSPELDTAKADAERVSQRWKVADQHWRDVQKNPARYSPEQFQAAKAEFDALDAEYGAARDRVTAVSRKVNTGKLAEQATPPANPKVTRLTGGKEEPLPKLQGSRGMVTPKSAEKLANEINDWFMSKPNMTEEELVRLMQSSGMNQAQQQQTLARFRDIMGQRTVRDIHKEVLDIGARGTTDAEVRQVLRQRAVQAESVKNIANDLKIAQAQHPQAVPQVQAALEQANAELQQTHQQLAKMGVTQLENGRFVSPRGSLLTSIGDPVEDLTTMRPAAKVSSGTDWLGRNVAQTVDEQLAKDRAARGLARQLVGDVEAATGPAGRLTPQAALAGQLKGTVAAADEGIPAFLKAQVAGSPTRLVPAAEGAVPQFLKTQIAGRGMGGQLADQLAPRALGPELALGAEELGPAYVARKGLLGRAAETFVNPATGRPSVFRSPGGASAVKGLGAALAYQYLGSPLLRQTTGADTNDTSGFNSADVGQFADTAVQTGMIAGPTFAALAPALGLSGPVGWGAAALLAGGLGLKAALGGKKPMATQLSEARSKLASIVQQAGLSPDQQDMVFQSLQLSEAFNKDDKKAQLQAITEMQNTVQQLAMQNLATRQQQAQQRAIQIQNAQTLGSASLATQQFIADRAKEFNARQNVADQSYIRFLQNRAAQYDKSDPSVAQSLRDQAANLQHFSTITQNLTQPVSNSYIMSGYLDTMLKNLDQYNPGFDLTNSGLVPQSYTQPAGAGSITYGRPPSSLSALGLGG